MDTVGNTYHWKLSTATEVNDVSAVFTKVVHITAGSTKNTTANLPDILVRLFAFLCSCRQSNGCYMYWYDYNSAIEEFLKNISYTK